jgi:hypothetical protein
MWYCWSSQNKLPWTWRSKIIEMYCFIVLETKIIKSDRVTLHQGGYIRKNPFFMSGDC